MKSFSITSCCSCLSVTFDRNLAGFLAVRSKVFSHVLGKSKIDRFDLFAY